MAKASVKESAMINESLYYTKLAAISDTGSAEKNISFEFLRLTEIKAKKEYSF